GIVWSPLAAWMTGLVPLPTVTIAAAEIGFPNGWFEPIITVIPAWVMVVAPVQVFAPFRVTTPAALVPMTRLPATPVASWMTSLTTIAPEPPSVSVRPTVPNRVMLGGVALAPTIRVPPGDMLLVRVRLVAPAVVIGPDSVVLKVVPVTLETTTPVVSVMGLAM